jgi:hypothetical protein
LLDKLQVSMAAEMFLAAVAHSQSLELEQVVEDLLADG